MNKVSKVANRVQLISRRSGRAEWLSLAYFFIANFSSFCHFISPFLFYFPLSVSPVPQPLLSPSFSGSRLYKGVRVRVSEWALWRQSIPYQLLPNTGTLTSLTANYYFFMTQPGAITATSLRCTLPLLQLSECIPGGILQELRQKSLSPTHTSAKTDWQTGVELGGMECNRK